MDRDCKTIREAILVVERYESVLGGPKDKKQKCEIRGVYCDDVDTATGLNTVHSLTTESTQRNIAEMLDAISDRLEQIEKQQRSKPRRNLYQREQGKQRRCFGCGAPDHLVRQCPNKKTESDTTQQGNDRPSSQ